MARKSIMRTMFTSRWLRWRIARTLALAFPSLGRWMNFPVRMVDAMKVADDVIEDQRERITLRFPEQEFENIRKMILEPSMENDAGDCSTYAQGYTPLTSKFAIVRDCVVIGRTLCVLRAQDGALLFQNDGIADWNRAKPVIRIRDRSARPGPHVVLTCNGHFFHFFSNDLLPLVHLMDRHGGGLGEVSVVVGDHFPPFVFDTLAALSRIYPGLRIVRLRQDGRLVGADVLWHFRWAETGWVPTNMEEAHRLREVLLSHLPPSAAPAETQDRIFVSRGGARLRRLLNENEVVGALASHDFGVFTPRGDDLRAQVEAFRSARVIVSVHGAALTNLLYCQPGARVVELFPADRVKSVYCVLANVLGLDYRYVIGARGDFTEGFSVDLEAVIAAAK